VSVNGEEIKMRSFQEGFFHRIAAVVSVLKAPLSTSSRILESEERTADRGVKTEVDGEEFMVHGCVNS
jgi:hypothetical protein